MQEFEHYVGRLTTEDTIELTRCCLEVLPKMEQLETIKDFLSDNHDLRDEVVLHFEGCLGEEEAEG